MARRMKLRCARCALAATTDVCTVPAGAADADEFASTAWMTGAAVAVPVCRRAAGQAWRQVGK